MNVVTEFAFNDVVVSVCDTNIIPFPGVYHYDGKLLLSRHVYENMSIDDLKPLLWYGYVEKLQHELGDIKGLTSSGIKEDPFNICTCLVGLKSMEESIEKALRLH